MNVRRNTIRTSRRESLPRAEKEFDHPGEDQSGEQARRNSIQSQHKCRQDPQDGAEYEAGIRQRSNMQRSISLSNTSRFLRSSTSTKRSTCQMCYKGKFQQPRPNTENSGDALGAVYRHSRQHFLEQAEACAAHRHSTRARSWRCQVRSNTKFPRFGRCRRRLKSFKFRTSTR